MDNVKKKPYIDSKQCVGCSLCIETCMQECLELSKPKFHGDINTYAILARPEKCMGCGLCVKACPIKIITMSEI